MMVDSMLNTDICFDAEKYMRIIDEADFIEVSGRVTKVIGLVIEAKGSAFQMGEICMIRGSDEKISIYAEVVGFKEDHVLLMPLGSMSGIGPGAGVISTGSPLTVKVGEGLIGRVLDGLGRPCDGKGHLDFECEYAIDSSPPNPLTRRRIKEPLRMGVSAIDALLTVGRGQRIGVFAGSGVGKSTLLGMVARNTEADINVVALIGERGREVREFIEKDLGEDGLARSIVVVATSDQPALVRLKGAFVATAIAEYFRDQGRDVMLMMDSVTRFAMAQREIGLAVGEPPATKGYTPSVFALLPKLLERSGTSAVGSITGLYTVLVDGDDMNEPIADSARGILDGHIVLSRKLAEKNHYPAIDILASLSRVMTEITDKQHQRYASKVRNILAEYREAEDLINIGAYVSGSNPSIDNAIKYIDRVNEFLRQDIYEARPFESSMKRLHGIFDEQ